MDEVFGNCEVVKKDKGYYILRSVKEMRAVDLIQKKRDGQELSSSEIQWLIEGYVSGIVLITKWPLLLWQYIFRE